jgi:hypothetical protein
VRLPARPPLPRSRGSQIYLGQLVVVTVGLLLTVLGLWRAGVATIGASFLLSALLRAVVPQSHDGMLRVRGRVFDVVWTGLLGAALFFLAFNIPGQPG